MEVCVISRNQELLQIIGDSHNDVTLGGSQLLSVTMVIHTVAFRGKNRLTEDQDVSKHLIGCRCDKQTWVCLELQEWLCDVWKVGETYLIYKDNKEYLMQNS